jgi:protein SCO1/2
VSAEPGDPTDIDSVRTPPILQEFTIGGDFALQGHDGATFDLAEHRGEVFLLFFGYTHCPDFCPATLSLLAQVYDLVGDEAADVRTLFVTIDPARDTPEAMAQYLGYFGVPALGLTGTEDEVARVLRQYAGMAEMEPDADGNPIFGHSTYTYLIDHEGQVRYLFRADDTPVFIAAGLREQVRLTAAAHAAE